MPGHYRLILFWSAVVVVAPVAQLILTSNAGMNRGRALRPLPASAQVCVTRGAQLFSLALQASTTTQRSTYKHRASTIYPFSAKFK